VRRALGLAGLAAVTAVAGDWRGEWIGAPAAARTDAVLGLAVESASADQVNWVQVDLGRSTRIDRVVLHPMVHDDPPAGGRFEGYGFPLRFKLEAAADDRFAAPTVIADHTAADYPNPGARPVVFATAVTARFVRLTVTRSWRRGPGLPHVYTLGELEVLAEGRNVARGAPVAASASTEGYGWGKAQLTDGRALVPATPPGEGRAFPHGALYLRRAVTVDKPVTGAVVRSAGWASPNWPSTGARSATMSSAPDSQRTTSGFRI
jgi:hypothetical protein